MTGAVFMILFIKNHIIWFPSVQHCNWFGFRISLSREGAIFRDEIENYFSCSRLARRDRDYHMTILVFRDENEIPFCYSHVSRRDRDFRKSFLVVEREKMKLTLVENSRDREFSLTSERSLMMLNFRQCAKRDDDTSHYQRLTGCHRAHPSKSKPHLPRLAARLSWMT